jgi:RNA polymerase sigma-70 factor (ECF subfamily)
MKGRPKTPATTSTTATTSKTAVRTPAPRPVEDEGALVARLQAGEEAAFEEVVRLYGPKMLAVARRLLPKEADAEDALQDAFVSVYRSVGSFQGGSRLSTWLHRVTVNAALMRIRARSRRPDMTADDSGMDSARQGRAEGWSFTAAEALQRVEIRDGVRAGLARLPEDVRAVVRLRDIQGLDLREIGALLDIGLSTVKARLHRGRLALRTFLDARIGAA